MEFVLIGIGIFIGVLLTVFLLRKSMVGTLLVNTSDPDDASYLFLELSKDVSDVTNKRYVVLKVNASQK